MRYARAAAATVGAVIIGVLAAAWPAQATTKPVVTAITDVGCGTATVSIVLADGVTGVYNARYYLDGEEAGKVASTGTTLAAKVLTFDEDTSGGEVDLWVSVIDGPESDYRPKTIAATVKTDCRRPAKPAVEVTAPTCEQPGQAIKVSNPNTLAKDVVKVRIGSADPVELGPGESTSASVQATTFVWVKVGAKWWPLKKVVYTPPVCPTATAAPTASATPSVPPVPGAGGGDSDGGGLPVTGAPVAAAVGTGLALLAAGGLGLLLARRRRRVRFTA